MDLSSAVEKYLEVVKEFGRAMPLSQFGVPKPELETMLSAWDEDYHLNRHFDLIPTGSSANAPEPSGDYLVNELPYEAIVFRESIRNVLR